MKMRRVWFVISSLIISLGLISPLSASDIPDEQWYPTLAADVSATNFQGLLIQENPKIAQKISLLWCGGNGNDGSLARFCSSLDDENNRDKTLSPGYDAILPNCLGDNDKNCIAGISAISETGKSISGVYVRNFPESGNSDFAASPERNFPAGKTPSLWRIPGVNNGAGSDEYLVRFTLRGTVMSSLDKNCPSCANFKGYSAIITPVSIKKGNYSRVEARDARGIDPSECSINPGICQLGWGSQSTDETRNCAALENGACALMEEFPTGYRFKLDVRLGASPTGWIHGRVKSPNVSLTKLGSFTQLSVEGLPVISSRNGCN